MSLFNFRCLQISIKYVQGQIRQSSLMILSIHKYIYIYTHTRIYTCLGGPEAATELLRLASPGFRVYRRLGCAADRNRFHPSTLNFHAQVIKSPEWGEVLWRQYELPTNLRCLRLAGKLSVLNSEFGAVQKFHCNC